MENMLGEIIKKYSGKKIIVRSHPYVASHLSKGWIFSVRAKWSRVLHRRIRIEPISSYDFLEYHFIEADGTEIVL
jgi:ribonuclease G